MLTDGYRGVEYELIVSRVAILPPASCDGRQADPNMELKFMEKTQSNQTMQGTFCTLECQILFSRDANSETTRQNRGRKLAVICTTQLKEHETIVFCEDHAAGLLRQRFDT